MEHVIAGHARAATSRGWPPCWLAAAFIGYVIVVFGPVMGDGDTYWHIGAGTWILQHREIPHTDPFSYSFAGAPWVAHEWLSEVLMALAYKAGGWNALVALYGAASALTFALLAHHLARWLDALGVVVVLVCAAACVAPSMVTRPHLLALPVMVLWSIALFEAKRKGTAPSFLLLPIMTLWANLHGSFIFGLVILMTIGIEALVDTSNDRVSVARQWSLFFAAATVASLLNPNGWHGLVHPVQLMSMKSNAIIQEWKSLDFQHLQPLELALATLLYVGFSRGVRLPVSRVFMLFGLIHMALQHSRHQMVAGVLGAVLLAEPLGRALRGGDKPATVRPAGAQWILGALACVLVVTAIRVAHPVVRTDSPVSPITALKHVPAEILKEPVFNSYEFGGYLIFRNVKPIIDGRADMYGDDFVSAYLAASAPDRNAFERLVTKYQVRWAILHADSAVAVMMDTLPDWQRIYADDQAVVYVRKG
ncbi:hypothetical protein GCT13_13120 [Paraburkholderia sp. CNPSo 3157]|uniref:Glycosyltransferase RgtA/B/C/D-like domain-containing protein n=1 Tax=Paraburkholderia franconis TaxID=2654983 RepID=A0A7X1N9F0_9BURK|nr:hypothetical protein [Paraburkholderia franconis]MPW17853.1 hypothetical protein [Paraburkholderia franconis]